MDLDISEIQSILDAKLEGALETEEPEVEPEVEAVLDTSYEPPEWEDHPDFTGVQHRMVDASWLFALPGLSGLTTRQYQGFEGGVIPVPEIDENYELNGAMIRALIVSSNTQLKGLYIGHTGCGKTSGIEQFAARTGRPFHRQEHDAFTDDQKIFGSLELKDGETYHNKSDLIRAMALPAVVALDELGRCPSATSMAYNPFLDRRQARITSHQDDVAETIDAHPEFMITATDNTAGNGDNIDLYNSANVMDEAIRNRFDQFINVPYMSESSERKLIKRLAPDLDESMVRKMAKFSKVLHKGFEDRVFTSAFSVRNILAIISMREQGMDTMDAIRDNYFNRVADAEKGGVREVIESVFGDVFK